MWNKIPPRPITNEYKIAKRVIEQVVDEIGQLDSRPKAELTDALCLEYSHTFVHTAQELAQRLEVYGFLIGQNPKAMALIDTIHSRVEKEILKEQQDWLEENKRKMPPKFNVGTKVRVSRGLKKEPLVGYIVGQARVLPGYYQIALEGPETIRIHAPIEDVRLFKES